MWELIQSNKRKSFFLFIAMGLCLMTLGYFLGGYVMGDPRTGGIYGVIFATAIWLIMASVGYFNGDAIMLAACHAKEVSHDVHPQLYNVVEEMKIAANLKAMPRVYIIPDPTPNAFATGRKPEKSAIAVTAGLLAKLNRDELQGVIAHEMSHIMNRDVLYMTFAGVMLGSIVMISEVFLRGMWYTGAAGSRYRSRSRGGNQGAMAIVAIVFAILAPIVARLLYFAISRKREYLADASAVRLSRYPEGLASALEKISSNRTPLANVNKVTAPMFIVNPLRKRGTASLASNWGSTHPPIKERIAILRKMSQGVNYTHYQKAFMLARGKQDKIIPRSGLSDRDLIPIRQSKIPTDVPAENKIEKRNLGDMLMAVNQYAFLACVCGLKIKIPPDFKKDKITCPRCRRELEVPTSELATMAAAVGTVLKEVDKTKAQKPKLEMGNVYKRKGTGWESFKCSCGKILQLSPSFQGTSIMCNSCRKRTQIT